MTKRSTYKATKYSGTEEVTKTFRVKGLRKAKSKATRLLQGCGSFETIDLWNMTAKAMVATRDAEGWTDLV